MSFSPYHANMNAGMMCCIGRGRKQHEYERSKRPPKKERNGRPLSPSPFPQKNEEDVAEAPKVEAEIPHSAQKCFSEFLSFLRFAPS